jgi:3-phytase
MSHDRKVLLLVGSIVLTCSFAAAQTDIPATFSTTQTPRDADDPAIWIHPTDPSRSLIIGVDKFEGVYVWNMSGELLQHLPQGSASRVNNIDVRYDFQLGGQSVDVVATNLRDAGKLAFFTVNPDYVQDDVLTQIAGLESTGNDIQDGSYGLTLYRRVSDGSLYLIERDGSGELRQYLITDDGTGNGIVVTQVRDFVYNGGLAEGMVVDDELGYLYVAEEDVAVYKYLADPSVGVDDSIATFRRQQRVREDGAGVGRGRQMGPEQRRG